MKPPVAFAGTLTEEDFGLANRLHGSGILPIRVAVPLCNGVPLVLAAFSFCRVATRARCCCFSVSPSFFGFIFGLQAWMARRSWRTHKLAQEPMRGAMGSEEFVVESEHGSSRIPWDRLHQWRASDSILLVYQSSNIFLLLPRRFFVSDEAWRSASDLVAAKLPIRKRRHAKWMLWLVVGWVALIALLALLFTLLLHP